MAPAPPLGIGQREAHRSCISLNHCNELIIAAIDTSLKSFMQSLQTDQCLLIIEMKGTWPLLFLSPAKHSTNIDVLIDCMTLLYEEICVRIVTQSISQSSTSLAFSDIKLLLSSSYGLIP